MGGLKKDKNILKTLDRQKMLGNISMGAVSI